MFNIEDTDDFYADLFGRLQCVEFFLQVVMAQLYSTDTKEGQNETLSKIVALVRDRTSINPNSTDAEREFLERAHSLMIEHTETLSAKIARRANEIREERGGQ